MERSGLGVTLLQARKRIGRRIFVVAAENGRTRVIVPVMWPGIDTVGLDSFQLADNESLLSSMRINGKKMTMPTSSAHSITAESDALLMQDSGGALNMTLPLITLVAVFQRQIVSGLAQGAVKG